MKLALLVVLITVGAVMAAEGVVESGSMVSDYCAASHCVHLAKAVRVVIVEDTFEVCNEQVSDGCAHLSKNLVYVKAQENESELALEIWHELAHFTHAYLHDNDKIRHGRFAGHPKAMMREHMDVVKELGLDYRYVFASDVSGMSAAEVLTMAGLSGSGRVEIINDM